MMWKLSSGGSWVKGLSAVAAASGLPPIASRRVIGDETGEETAEDDERLLPQHVEVEEEEEVVVVVVVGGE